MSKEFYKGVFTASACIFLGSSAVAVYNYFSKPKSTKVIVKCYSCGCDAHIKLRAKRHEIYGKSNTISIKIGGAVDIPQTSDDELITVDACNRCYKLFYRGKTDEKIYPDLYNNVCMACFVGKNHANVNIVDVGNINVCKTCLDKYIEMDKTAIANNTKLVFVRNVGIPDIKYIEC